MRSLAKFISKNTSFARKTMPLAYLAHSHLATTKLTQKPQRYFYSAPKPEAVVKAHQNVLKSTYEGDGFYVEQMLVGCLAIYSYYLESNGEAFIIDPQNDISKYVDILNERKATLRGVFMTHYHADYVAGHNALRRLTGCKIYMGPHASQEKGVISLKDEQTINLGNIKLKLMHTPGHTQESSCLVVNNKSGKNEVVFSGDTVFLNEVGRPDLAVKSDLSAEDLAKLLYKSIQKFKQLEDDVRIYPGHGSGSSCGKSIGSGDFCSVGTQKVNNYALRSTNKEEFVKLVLEGMPNPPAYFSYNAQLNKFDEFNYEEALTKAKNKISMEQFNELRSDSSVRIVDLGGVTQQKNGAIYDTVCIDFNGGFANWAGTLLSPKDQIVLYGNEEMCIEAINRLLRIGYTNIRGYSTFSIEDWKAKGLPYYVPDYVDSVYHNDRTVLDVRKPQEWKEGVANTQDLVNFELSDLFSNYEKLDKSKKYVVHCKSGYRARLAYSLLKSKGFDVKVFPFGLEMIGKLRSLA